MMDCWRTQGVMCIENGSRAVGRQWMRFVEEGIRRRMKKDRLMKRGRLKRKIEEGDMVWNNLLRWSLTCSSWTALEKSTGSRISEGSVRCGLH